MERPRQIVLLVRARRHDLGLRALRHPGCAALRQEVDSEFIRKDHHLMRTHVFVRKPNPRQAFNAMWVIIFGHQFGAFPDPADLLEPAAHGFCGHLDPMLGLERHGECGTAPSGAAPAIGPWGFFEEGAERAREPGHQDSGLDRDGELPVWINPDAEASGAIRSYDPVYAGA